MAKIIELIYAEEKRGLGREDNPSRIVRQLWTKDGYLVGEADPCGKDFFDGGVLRQN